MVKNWTRAWKCVSKDKIWDQVKVKPVIILAAKVILIGFLKEPEIYILALLVQKVLCLDISYIIKIFVKQK